VAVELPAEGEAHAGVWAKREQLERMEQPVRTEQPERTEHPERTEQPTPAFGPRGR
jgi:hypothetical protein